MKKILFGMAFTACIAFAVQAEARGNYNQNYNYNNNSNAFTGAVVGTLIGSLLSNTLQPRTNYIYPQPVFAQPVFPIAVPLAPYPYYAPLRACNTVRVPVMDASGRLIEYVQLCAN